MRRKGDYYPTPSWCVRALLETVDLPTGTWLEPTAGDGAIIRAAQGVRPEVQWDAIEINPIHQDDLLATGAVVTIGDVMTADLQANRYQLVLGNPPYSHSEEIITRILDMVTCPVAMLLPLPFLAGQRRQALYDTYGVPDVYVLPRRPSFVDGGTAAVDYAWMVWASEWYRGIRPGRIERIPLEVCCDRA